MAFKKLAIGNDHVAVDMKNEIMAYLQEKGYEVVNVGTDSAERFNYPVSGYKVARMVVAPSAFEQEQNFRFSSPLASKRCTIT